MLVLLDLLSPASSLRLPQFFEPVVTADRSGTGESFVGGWNFKRWCFLAFALRRKQRGDREEGRKGDDADCNKASWFGIHFGFRVREVADHRTDFS